MSSGGACHSVGRGNGFTFSERSFLRSLPYLGVLHDQHQSRRLYSELCGSRKFTMRLYQTHLYPCGALLKTLNRLEDALFGSDSEGALSPALWLHKVYRALGAVVKSVHDTVTVAMLDLPLPQEEARSRKLLQLGLPPRRKSSQSSSTRRRPSASRSRSRCSSGCSSDHLLRSRKLLQHGNGSRESSSGRLSTDTTRPSTNYRNRLISFDVPPKPPATPARRRRSSVPFLSKFNPRT